MKFFKSIKYKLLKKFDKDDRTNLKNAIFSLIGQIVTFVTLFVVTPLLFLKFGREGTGVVMMFNTLTGFSGLLSVGMGQATLKYVSKYRALNQLDKIGLVIRTTLTFYFIIGIMAGIVILFSGEWLANSVFKISDVYKADAEFTFKFMGLGFLAGLMREGLSAAIKGFERFDVTVSIQVFIRVILLVGQVFLLLAGYGIKHVVALLISATILEFIISLAVLKIHIYPKLLLWTSIDRDCLKESFGFGIYTWLGSLLVKLRETGPPMILGILVGLESVAIYNTGVRILRQLSNLISSSGQYLFPYISRLHELGDREKILKHYDHLTKIILVISAACFTPLFVCGLPILVIWLGEDVGKDVMPVVQILAVRFALLPFGIMNYSFLLATGRAKISFLVNLISFVVVLLSSLVGGWLYGFEGVVWAQLSIFVPMLGNRIYLEKVLFNKVSFFNQWVLILGISLPLVFGIFFTLDSNAYWLWIAIAVLFWSVIGSLVAYTTYELFRKFGGQNKLIKAV